MVKAGIKTLNEKIDIRLKSLLARKAVKYNLKEKKTFLVNGIEYIHEQLAGAVEKMKFTKHHAVPLIHEEVVP